MSEPLKTAPRVLVQQRSHKDPQMLDLDKTSLEAGRHYRWVRSRGDESHMAVTKHKLRGYRVETLKEGGPRTLVELESRPDKVIAIGDLILMSCPEEVHEKRQIARKARTEAMLASTSAQTEQMAKDKGVVIVKDPDHGKVTQE